MIAGLVAAQSMRVVFVAGVVVLAGLAIVVRRVMADSGRLEPVGARGRVLRRASVFSLRARSFTRAQSRKPGAGSRKPAPTYSSSAVPCAFVHARVVVSCPRARRRSSSAAARGAASACARCCRLSAHPERRRLYVKIPIDPFCMTARRTPAPSPERAALVGVVTGGSGRDQSEASLRELAGLVDAAGATVVVLDAAGAPLARSRDLHRQGQGAEPGRRRATKATWTWWSWTTS